ncbi:MAG: type II toxin-antitoxin system PemK/MazF family toxin, partial [Planctomycetota bacterium]
PTVVMSSSAYLDTRPDVLLGILTTQIQAAKTAFDHVILDWQAANLRRACMYRSYFGTVPQGSVQLIGRLSARDIEAVRHCLAAAIG